MTQTITLPTIEFPRLQSIETALQLRDLLYLPGRTSSEAILAIGHESAPKSQPRRDRQLKLCREYYEMSAEKALVKALIPSQETSTELKDIIDVILLDKQGYAAAALQDGSRDRNWSGAVRHIVLPGILISLPSCSKADLRNLVRKRLAGGDKTPLAQVRIAKSVTRLRKADQLDILSEAHVRFLSIWESLLPSGFNCSIAPFSLP